MNAGSTQQIHFYRYQLSVVFFFFCSEEREEDAESRPEDNDEGGIYKREREERKREWNTKWSQDQFEPDSEEVPRSIEASAMKMKAWISALALLPSMILSVA